MASQDDFRSAYHNRHSAVHQIAYMRLGKTYLLQEALSRNGIDLSGLRILDYGFGPGNFLRVCPSDARLFGVELDPRTVEDVRAMLAPDHPYLDLQPIDVNTWADHPLLQQRYDLIVCSHVLEHLPDPVAFLDRIKSCLVPGGRILVLLPINELELDIHHFTAVDESLARSWVDRAGLSVDDLFQGDTPGYWLRAFAMRKGPVRWFGMLLKFATGLAARIAGRRLWRGWSEALGALRVAKPAQLALLLRDEGEIAASVEPVAAAQRAKEAKEPVGMTELAL